MRHLSTTVGTATLIAIGLTYGCKMPVDAGLTAASGSAVVVQPAKAKASESAPLFTSAPKIMKSETPVPDDGMSYVTVKVNINEEKPAIAAPQFSLKVLPGAWTDAVVTLFSATASTGYQNATHRVTLLEPSFSAPPRQAVAAFPPLRPAADYTARVFLRNDQGGLVAPALAGSLQMINQSLNAGANTLIFNVNVNANELTYEVTAGTSANLNVVTGNNIVKGDTVTLATGMAANQSGVDHLDVKLSGAAYGGGSCLLARLTTPASWNNFVWNTANAGVAPANFVAATLAGGAGVTTNLGTIDVEAYHANDATTPVATSQFDVNVFGRPTVTVQVQ